MGDAVWHVAATKTAKEFLAAAHLRNQGFLCYIPQLRKTVRHARRMDTRPVPLFPGYIFVDGSVGARWRSINGTVGIKYLVTSNERPAVVEAEFVEVLRQMTSIDGIVDLSRHLRIGDSVEFASGPMARKIGRLVELDGRGRVAVLMEFFSGEVLVRTTPDKLLPA